MKINKGDEVKILLGKDRGKSGKVVRVLTKKGQVVVEGINLYKRSLPGNILKRQGAEKGQIIEITKPIDVSNVALICPNCNKVIRVGFKVDKLSKFRICQKCQKPIDKKE